MMSEERLKEMTHKQAVRRTREREREPLNACSKMCKDKRERESSGNGSERESALEYAAK